MAPTIQALSAIAPMPLDGYRMVISHWNFFSGVAFCEDDLRLSRCVIPSTTETKPNIRNKLYWYHAVDGFVLSCHAHETSSVWAEQLENIRADGLEFLEPW